MQTDGPRRVFAIEPGESRVQVEWSMPAGDGFIQSAPQVLIGGDAANVQIEWVLPDHRWVLWTWGPSWGPVVTVWQYLLVLLLAAFLLARHTAAPLSRADWFLLGLGLTQVPAGLPVVLVVWFVCFAHRGRGRPKHWFAHDIVQVALLGLTFASLGVLYAAVYQGLVLEPDLGVSGGGSWRNTLRWFTDRSGPELPRPGLVWLPM